MPVDLRKVALISGVSTSTASRALAGSTLVSAATRARVSRVAKDLGYRPNASARTLRTGDSRLVGLVITNLVNNSFRVIAEMVQQRLAENGYHLVLTVTDGHAEQERTALHTLLELGASGLIAVGSDNEAFAEVRARSMPVVHLGRRPDLLAGACVLGDESRGAATATALLLGHGHRRIAFVGGPASVLSGRERLRGYRNAMTKAGRPVDPSWIVRGPFTAETGIQAVDTWMALPAGRRPTGILVANHESTYGVLPRLRELSVRIPEDISVVGYEDAPVMRWWSPPITVIDNQPEKMADLVSTLLLQRISDPQDPAKPQVHRVPVLLRERASVARVPARAPRPTPV